MASNGVQKETFEFWKNVDILEKRVIQQVVTDLVFAKIDLSVASYSLASEDGKREIENAKELMTQAIEHLYEIRRWV